MAIEKKKKGKVIDNWKEKEWYAVIAPDMFSQKEVGKIVSGEEENMLNRIVRVGLGEVSEGGSQADVYTRLDFRVKEVKGRNAYTKLIGHELIPGYVKTIIRRRRSLITGVVDVKTQDGMQVRVKYMVIAGNKTSDGLQTIARNAISAEFLEAATKCDFPNFMQEIIFGKLQKRIFIKVKTLAPIRRIEVRRSEVLEKFESAKEA